jgi:hypothetical protein
MHLAVEAAMSALAHISTRDWHNWAVIATAMPFVVLPACGGQTDSAPSTPGDASHSPTDASSESSLANDDVATHADAADESDGHATIVDAATTIDGWWPPDAVGPPEPCNGAPLGTWTVRYDGVGNGRAACGLSPTSELRITEGDAGVNVSYLPCDQALGSTGCADGGTFEPASCVVKAWTYSAGLAGGEPQCVRQNLTLFFHGDIAEGTMSYERCWCNSQYPPLITTYRATAVRISPTGL